LIVFFQLASCCCTMADEDTSHGNTANSRANKFPIIK
jgi:hypothetical protein